MNHNIEISKNVPEPIQKLNNEFCYVCFYIIRVKENYSSKTYFSVVFLFLSDVYPKVEKSNFV